MNNIQQCKDCGKLYPENKQKQSIDPFSTELLTYMHQLREMRLYFENHKYFDEYQGCDITKVLLKINDSLDYLAEGIGMIGFEVKNEAYYFDEEERRVS